MTEYNNQQQPPQPPRPQSDNKAIAALVCGILGLIGGWFPVVQYFTLILAIIAIVLGVKARRESMERGAPTGLATAGMILGIVAVALSVVMIMCVCTVGSALLMDF